MIKILLALYSLILLAASFPAFSATYYVSVTGNNANPGTEASPWRTIGKAVSVAGAGDTTIIKDGAYVEPMIEFLTTGTSGAPITFKAQNQWAAIVSSTSGCNPAFSIGTVSYLTIENLRFSVDPTNVACGSYSSANVAIRAWENSTGLTVRGVKVDASSQRALGIKSAQDNTLIENSELHDAVETFKTLNSVIRNNTFIGIGEVNGAHIITKGGDRNVQIYNNIIKMQRVGGRGIIIGGSSSCCVFDPNTYIEAYNSVAYNNVIVNETSGNVVGLTLWGAKDSAFFNNVVIGGSISMVRGGQDPGIRSPVQNPTWKNNIFKGSNLPATSDSDGWGTEYTGTLTVAYNDFFNYSSNVPAQTNAVTGDPLFVNPLSDWHLQAGSPAIDSGTVTSQAAYGGGTLDVSKDKDGVTRTTPWDLGIYNTVPGGPTTTTTTTTSSTTTTTLPPATTTTSTTTTTLPPTTTTTLPPGCGSTNIALNDPATASTTQNNFLWGAAKANDGNTSTYWWSTTSNPQWVRFDLGSVQSICRVKLDWKDANYAVAYKIQRSNDGSVWTDMFSTAAGDGGIDDLTGLSGSGRYIRMHATSQFGTVGLQLREMKVFQ